MKSHLLQTTSSLFCLFLSTWGFAATEIVNGIEWTYTIANDAAILAGGYPVASPAVPQETSGAITIPAFLGGYLVVRIGENAFSGCSNITSVTIPDSVMGISDRAGFGRQLWDTNSIPGVVLVDGWAIGKNSQQLGSNLELSGIRGIADRAFALCQYITSVFIGDGVRSIGYEAFENCSRLRQVSIPDSVTYVSRLAFSNCKELTSPLYNQSKTALWHVNESFSGSFRVLDGTKRIGGSAFDSCQGLTSVTIPSSVTNIGNEAFYSCENLEEVRISDLSAWCRISFEHSDSGPYYGNPLLYADRLVLNGENITNLVIPDDVTHVGDFAFIGCSGLTSVTIPSNVTSIGGGAFSGCSGLTSVNISDLAAWCGVSFGSAGANPLSCAKHLFQEGVEISHLTIPSSVTSIGAYAFFGGSDLTSVMIPESVTNIGSSSFYNCSGLTSIIIPDSVRSIGSDVFFNCSGLTRLEIPEHLQNCITQLKNGNTATIVLRARNGEFISDFVSFSDSSLPDGQVGKHYRVKIVASTTSNPNPRYRSASSLPIGISLSDDGWLAGTPHETVEDFPVTIMTDDGRNHTFTLTIRPLGYDWLTSGIWKYEVENGEVVIRRCSQTTGSVTVPETINGYPVKTIEAAHAVSFDEFGSATNIFIPAVVFEPGIISIQFPSNLRNLGAGAVAASGISDLTIPAGVTNVGYYAATLCRGLQSVQIGAGVKTIQDAAFTDCSELQTIIVPNTVRKMGIALFERCSRLESASIQADCPVVPASIFHQCVKLSNVSLPPNATNIQSLAFANCSQLRSIDIPESVQELGFGCFAGCARLSSFDCPDALQRIMGKGFSGCTNLASIQFNESIRQIWTNAFENCTSLGSITLPDSLEMLAPESLKGCKSIVSLSLPFIGISTNVPENSEWSGLGAVFGVEPYEGSVEMTQVFDPDRGLVATWQLPGALKTVELHGNSLAPGSFSGCRTLENIRLTGAPVCIPDYAFAGCEGIRTISLPDSVEEIGAAAFGSCSALETVHLSTGLRTVDLIPFWQCTNLTEATWGTTGTLRMENPDGRFFGLGTKTEEEDYLAWTVETENPRDWIEWLVAGTGERRATGPTAGIRLSDTRSFLVRVTDMSTTAADTAILRFHDTASAPWIVTEDESAKGGFCLRSGEIPASTNSTIETTIAGPGRLSFKWKISAGRGDFCKFYLDGIETNSVGTRNGAMTDWTTVALDLPAGPHTLRWSYERGSGDAVGEDAAFLDDVDWRPEVSLFVASAWGAATPEAGTHGLVYGDEVAASVAEPAAADGTRRVCVGWTGTGSVPAGGDGTNVAFRIEEDSTLAWNWRTDHWIGLSVSGGTADFEPQWVEAGTEVVAEIVPATHLYAVALAGDTNGVTLAGTTLTIPADGPREISVTVEEVKVSLAVESEWGAPSPTNGVYALSWGTEIEASVAEPEPTDGVRYVCAGWTGTGSVPAGGDGTNVAFRIEEDSSIRWNWRTNVWIALATSGPVSADFAEAWTNLGATVVAGWTPSVPYFTVALSGDTDGVTLDEAARTVSIPADRPRSVALSVTELTLAEALDAPGLVWTTDGDAEWFPQIATSEDGTDAARSGSVLGSQTSTIQTILEGSGTFSWTWRLDSATGGNAGVDVLLDGSWKSLYAPGADWSRESLAIVGEGPHVIRFEFWNAGTEATAGDCAYLDQVSWTGEVPGGRKIDVNGVGIPFAWIETNAPAALVAAGGDYEAAALADAANGQPVWECYVAGLDPTNAASRFEARIGFENGEPIVTWTPDLNEGGTKHERVYMVEGKASLVDQTWGPTNEATRFFRVKVLMPEE